MCVPNPCHGWNQGRKEGLHLRKESLFREKVRSERTGEVVLAISQELEQKIHVPTSKVGVVVEDLMPQGAGQIPEVVDISEQI